MTEIHTESINQSAPNEILQNPQPNRSLKTIAHSIIRWLAETAHHNLFKQPLHN